MISSSARTQLGRNPRERGDVVVVVGATATGKSAVGLEIAARLGGEIVSADSRAFYRGMDILTDKPSRADRERVPHHLLDICSFDDSYDAMRFRQDADQAIRSILRRNRIPIVVGGGTLYIAAIVEGLFSGPSADPALRSELSGQSAERLHAMLRRADPVSAQRIHPNDRLRLVRALEVHRKTGTAISRLQTHAVPLDYTFHGFALHRDRSDHRQAIAMRVDKMLSSGLTDEVKALEDAGLRPTMQAFRTIGVPETLAFLAGEIDGTALRERLANRTWSLARRQTAWFRRLRGFQRIEIGPRGAGEAAQEILDRLSGRGLPSTVNR
ncbi:tRNA (adenosine(37)-N6)-dimethylallyltransferase MiaA [Candidatus Bipolaricaulota bacterium]|nr:tRNA (adenosine(37)-N6)-dimethylallyltransferase MiaA [Candidatus Bipolaricaulota bacterium]